MDIATLGIAVDSRQVTKAGRALDGFGSSATRAEKQVRNLVKIVAGSALLRGSQRLLDASVRIDNSLKVAGVSGAALTKVYDQLFDSAQRNVAPLESLVQLYSRASLVQNELGVSTEELLGFTDKVAVALRVSGKSAAESSGALLQLSQALGSGIVRAEEFNSILEGALPVAQAAAAGLDEAGGSVAKLRTLIVDGKVSSEAFFRAFEAGASILDSKVAGAELTVSQGFIRLQNVLTDTTGKFDDATGASSGLANEISQVADVVQYLGDVFTNMQGPLAAVGRGVDAVRGTFAEFREVTGIQSFFDGTSLIEGRIGFADPAAKMIEARAAAVDKLRSSLEKLPSQSPGGIDDSMAARFATAFGESTVSLKDYDILGDGTASKAQKAIDKVIESLAFQEAQLGRTAREQEIYNALNEAGVDIASRYGIQIAGAAGRVYDMASALDRAAERQQMVTATAKDFIGGFVSDLTSGTNAVDALTNSVERLADRLLDMALDQAINGLFGNLAGAFGNSIGGSLVSTGVGLFHSGRGPGDPLVRGRFVHPAVFDDAPRFHSGIGPGEMPAVIRQDESVLTPGQMRQLAPVGSRRESGTVNITLNNAPAGTTATATQSKAPDGGTRIDIVLKQTVDDTGASLIESGESAMNASLERRYKLTPQL